MKKIVLVVLSVAFTFTTASQTLDPNQLLPLDKTIRKGVLSNGMTYYLHSTDVTKNVASYYIIQNVGSVLENDDQQGLAHFLEHMAFNGTEHFEGKGILNTLEKEGIVFGKDINAYTSFDETVYNVDNIPTSPELIETGLQILHDWSNYLLLTEEEIDAERGVIKEEWRTRQNGRMRVLEQTIGTMFGESKYSKRLPIGLMDIVENFEYKALRDFYHDWYRTDLQAIAVVGDINLDEMEAKIKAKFSSIPAVKDAPERFVVKIDDNDKLLYSIGMDKEISTANLSFGIRHDKSLTDETVSDLRESLLNSMISSILGTRFKEISQQPDAPFMNVRAGYRTFSRVHNSLGVSISPKPGEQQAAFKLAMSEINRAVKFGFTKAEINITKAQLGSFYENQIAKLNDRSHKQLIQSIQKNYLENSQISDIEKEYDLVKSLFNQLTQEDLLARMQEIYTKKNRSLIVTGVEGKNNLTEEEAKQIINDVENDSSLQPYNEEEKMKSLMSGVELEVGKIVSEKKNEEIGFTTFALSNGINVHYKFADKNKNDVKLEAISDGGNSLINDGNLPSAAIVGNVAQMSGLGEFSMTDLPKVLAGKTAKTSFSIGETTEAVTGSSSIKDVETMLQMINLRFTRPRFDETAYNVLMQNVDNYLVRRSQALKEKMSDSVTTTLYGNNHSKKRIFNKEFVADMSFDKTKVVYESRFANAADFKFFVVGDVNEGDLKPLLEKYIASIPTSSTKENWTDNSSDWVSKTIDKDIYLSMEDPKSSVRIAIKNDMPFSLKNEILMSAIGKILQLRYTESLREQEGGTYGARSRGQLIKEPIEQAYLSVSFDCNPDLAEKLTSIVHSEMQNIKNGIIQQSDLDKVLANFLKEREESQNYNAYDMAEIKNYVLEGYNMSTPDNFDNIVNSITKEEIEDVMSRLLNDAETYEIIFKPKN